ncbi:hypothetical protein EIP91_001086 [Steccherinum ochraceum]|uniref:Major facilitator superfamily (MFS) profile domain-containing protein n=1 Tax=Steccherinum ochraceum TaxID=92696 RepID=A0A4R0RSA4_9APHY|nr:hypothetical protein EIP91_001086 [Steccherinum ochraceum]
MTASEAQPLLPPRHVEQTPLPKIKLAVVFALKLLIPVGSSQASPYINQRLEQILGGSANVGYYTGLVSSSYSIAQMLGMYPWARLSDRIGRRPVVLLGSVGIALCTFVFGFVDSLWGIVAIRFLTGIFCGTTGAMHAIVGELTDETNQSTAFPLYDIIAALGFMVGPLIGGTFVNPVAEHADWTWITRLGLRDLFTAYPYLLPNAIISAYALFTVALASGILDETLPSRKEVQQTQSHSSSSAPGEDTVVVADEELKENTTLSAWQMLRIPVIRSISVATFLLGFLGSGFNLSVVLMSYAKVSHGGLGLSPQQIGIAMSIMGGLSIFLKLNLTWILRPSPHSRQTVSQKLNSLFAHTMAAWPFTFFGFAVLGWIARAGVDGARSGLIWTVLSIVLFLSRIGCLPFTLVMLLVKENSPTPASLGTLNGLTELIQAISTVISPALIGSLFAFSNNYHVLGGYFWAAFYVACSIFAAVVAARIEKQHVEADAPARVEA